MKKYLTILTIILSFSLVFGQNFADRDDRVKMNRGAYDFRTSINIGDTLFVGDSAFVKMQDGTIKLLSDGLTGIEKALAQGLEWNQSSDEYKRLGSLAGIAKSVSAGDSALPIQSEMKRCLLENDGTVNYYLADTNSYMKQYTTIPFSDRIDYVNGDSIYVSGATFQTTADTGMWVHNVDSGYTAEIIGIPSQDTLVLSDSVFTVGDSLNQYNAILNGDDGQVMTEIPKFYYKFEAVGSKYRWYLSRYQLEGFTLHPAFLEDGQEVDYVYISSYEANMYDNSASSYVGGTGGTDTDNDTLSSVAGIKTHADEKITEYRTIAQNRGAGWEQWDATIYGAVQLLYLVEYADFNSQSTIGNGNTSYDSWDYDNGVGYAGFSNLDGNKTNASNTVED